ncbi:hypothetical protein TorRG33x02_289620 [Trema orientale]|uniref:Uncharacterized protein n=1 Tax=Trema orientale TaxID=63057 RepID=A0A2P5CD39_TREOI|nr:hypothetical protein TorRG33x02_289620 [Trema orientale]
MEGNYKRKIVKLIALWTNMHIVTVKVQGSCSTLPSSKSHATPPCRRPLLDQVDADSTRKRSCDKKCYLQCKKRGMIIINPRLTWCYGECMDYCINFRPKCFPLKGGR